MVFDTIWSTPPGYEELGGEFEAIKNGGIFWINNSSNFWIKLRIDLFRNGGPFIYSFVCISSQILKTLSPNGHFASNTFFRPKTISKVPIIKTKNAAIAFFSSPHSFFFSFPFPSLLWFLSFSGLRNLAFDAFSLKWLQISLSWFSKNRLDINEPFWSRLKVRIIL